MALTVEDLRGIAQNILDQLEGYDDLAEMEMLMQELDNHAGCGNDAACQIEELLLGAFQAVSEGDEETAETLVKEAVEVITYY